MQRVATIRQITRYPVKSMAGEPLAEARLTLQGLERDREYAFVQSASRGSFPWLTARELPAMLRYQPALAETSGAPDSVRTPEGAVLPVASEELRRELQARSGREVFLLRDYRGSFDAAPLSLISLQTAARLGEETGVPVQPSRFRPSIALELASGTAFEELAWVGRMFQFGEAPDAPRVAVIEATRRCAIINLDPVTAAASPVVLRTVTARHDLCAGIYAAVLRAGLLRGGDPVFDVSETTAGG
ncbi:MAG: MOSC domain-containing protein [Terriglobales bacterium]